MPPVVDVLVVPALLARVALRAHWHVDHCGVLESMAWMTGILEPVAGVV